MHTKKGGWFVKFGHAFRGLFLGIRGQSSFLVHLPTAILVVVASILLQVTAVELAILLLCIAGVLVAELFNSSIEHLARAVTREENPMVGACLDIASGAVLVASLFASFVGLWIFLPRVFI